MPARMPAATNETAQNHHIWIFFTLGPPGIQRLDDIGVEPLLAFGHLLHLDRANEFLSWFLRIFVKESTSPLYKRVGIIIPIPKSTKVSFGS